MGKKSKSQTLETSSTESKVIETAGIPESMKQPEAESPKPKFNGPTITFKDIDVKGGGVVSVTCLDDKVPLGKIQIIHIKTADAAYVYRRI